jgi:hypothetical protein
MQGTPQSLGHYVNKASNHRAMTAESQHKNVSWGVIAMLAAQFIMVLDTTVMNVSSTQVAADLNTTVVGLQAAITM